MALGGTSAVGIRISVMDCTSLCICFWPIVSRLSNPCVQIIYSCFFHPLRNVAGPSLAKFTSKWLSYIDHIGQKTETVHEYHEKYGSVVRVAPDELVFSDSAVIKQIYGFNTNYTKTDFYAGFEEKGKPVLFTLRDRGVHRNRRKLMSNAFRKQQLTLPNRSYMLRSKSLLGI